MKEIMSEKSENNNINLELDILQKGRIKVHTQIINDLSSGIYSSPASCIKELVNNSYDADAKSVIIRVKPVHDSITLIDDGKGMNAVDFDKKFAWISHSTKRKDSNLSDELKRPLIGKIGIGFIAVNEICNELEITSSKKGEKVKFTANINFKKYFEDAVVQNSENDEGIIKGEYELLNEEEDENEHYTIIRLLGLKDSVKNILEDKQYLSKILKLKNKNYSKDFFKSMKDLLEFHTANKLKSFSEDNAYVQFIIDLASFIPVEYIDGGPIEAANDKIIESIVKSHKELDFQVDLDGMYLKKPIYFAKNPKVNTQFISFNREIEISNSESKEDTDTIKLKGYFYIQHGILFPRELNGVSIRIRNIPIAEQFGFDDSFMRYPSYTNQLFRNWISGEIYIEKGLEDAMNIDRKSFRVTHPHYLALQNFLHKFLSEKVFKIALDLYEGARDFREKIKIEERKEEGKKILSTSKIEFKPSKPITKSDSIKNTKIEPKIIAPLRIINSTPKKTTIEVDESLANKFKKKDWEYLESIFLIFETAYRESNGNADKLRDYFYQKINEWKDINI